MFYHRSMEREAFKQAVFARDGGQCVVPWCDHYAVDAHHLMERALWEDEGYHIDNGVSLCSGHHKEAEIGLLSPQDLRKWAGITTTILPEGLDPSVEHDKWGKVKYPRTPHLPWSPGRTSDDRVLESIDHLLGREVVLTEKLDGENTTLYRTGYHARSLDTDYHPTRTWVQNLQSKIGWEIPEGWRICGENLAGRHAIEYRDLPSFFFVFSIWDNTNTCLSWDDTTEYCQMLGLEAVPTLVRQTFNSDLRDWLSHNGVDSPSLTARYAAEIEGYVIRPTDSFGYDEFGQVVAKYVRADHVDPSNRHWRHERSEFNTLA